MNIGNLICFIFLTLMSSISWHLFLWFLVVQPHGRMPRRTNLMRCYQAISLCNISKIRHCLGKSHLLRACR